MKLCLNSVSLFFVLLYQIFVVGVFLSSLLSCLFVVLQCCCNTPETCPKYQMSEIVRRTLQCRAQVVWFKGVVERDRGRVCPWLPFGQLSKSVLNLVILRSKVGQRNIPHNRLPATPDDRYTWPWTWHRRQANPCTKVAAGVLGRECCRECRVWSVS